MKSAQFRFLFWCVFLLDSKWKCDMFYQSPSIAERRENWFFWCCVMLSPRMENNQLYWLHTFKQHIWFLSMAFIVTASEYIFEIELIKKIFEGVFCAPTLTLSVICQNGYCRQRHYWEIDKFSFEALRKENGSDSSALFPSLGLRGICPSIEIVFFLSLSNLIYHIDMICIFSISSCLFGTWNKTQFLLYFYMLLERLKNRFLLLLKMYFLSRFLLQKITFFKGFWWKFSQPSSLPKTFDCNRF